MGNRELGIEEQCYSLPGSAWEHRSGGFASNLTPLFEAEPLDIGSQAEPRNQLNLKSKVDRLSTNY